MKILIISDIKSNLESIIPFGLRFGKHTETNVDVVHFIDPRAEHGVSSTYADSQSITPGEKLSHDKILDREKAMVTAALDKLLSREASRLNYPLKVDRIIEIDNAENAFKDKLNEGTDQMIVVNRDLESTSIESYNALLNDTKDQSLLIMSVPSGLDFTIPDKALIISDFTESSHKSLQLLFKWLHPFDIYYNATEVVKMSQMIESELKMEAWKSIVSKYLPSAASINTNTIQGNNYKETLLNYINRNDHDLVILPRENLKQSLNKSINSNSTKKLLKELNKVVIFY